MASGMGTDRGRTLNTRAGVRLRTYVGLLVLIPLLGFFLLATTALVPRLDVAKRARAAQEHTKRTEMLVQLSILIGNVQLPVQILSTATELEVPNQQLTLLLGYDPVQREKETKSELTAYVADHLDDPAVRIAKQEMAAVDAELTAGGLTDGVELFDRYARITEKLNNEARSESRKAFALGVDGSSRLTADLRSVESALRLVTIAGDQHQGLFRLAFGSRSNSQEVEAQQRRLIELRFSEARELVEVDKYARPEFREHIATLRDGKDTTTIHAELDRLINGEMIEVTGLSRLRLAGAVRSGASRSTGFSTLLKQTLASSLESGDRLEQSARRDLSVTLAMSVGVVTLSLLAAFLVSKLLTGPLHLLTNRARRVAEGVLDTQTESLRGPQEIRVVSAVVGELVANLQKVQAQTVALSRGTLDDETLEHAIPGPLGASIKAAVDRLSRSIHEREELQKQLTRQATHDSLTSLPNRAAAHLAVEQALARSRRRKETLAVLFIDLDEFKRANDERGHLVGDDVLISVAQRITGVVRTGDIVARLGGDEFLVVAETIDGADGARQLSDRIVAAIREPIVIDGQPIRVGASVGFALATDENDNATEMMRRADLAMYRAKETGRGRVVEFDRNLNRMTEERVAIERAIERALETDELLLHYQPVVDTISMQMVGVEALLRWDRVGHGPQAPGTFIPILEASPLILDVGRWVMRQACREIAELRRQTEFADVSVAVNLSGRHLLSAALLTDVRDALASANLPGEALTLEITETALVTDMATAVDNINALRAEGIRVAIDDFGTGYTSVSQLSRLPVNVLKIDRSLVEQIHTESNRRIVELVIELGHTLGLTIVGEGIEETAQHTTLRELGCDQIQGYLFGYPVPLNRLRSFETPGPVS